MRTFNERFAEYFAEQGNAEQVSIFNEWANSTGHEPICCIEEFDDICAGFTPMDIVRKVRFGDFNPCYDYFTFDGYANFESIENAAEWIKDYMDDMADYFADHYCGLANIIGTCDAGALYDEEQEDEEQDDEE